MSLYTDFTIVQNRVNPMPSALVSPRHQNARDEMIALATDGIQSPRTVRNYKIALNDFFDWHESIGAPMLSKALVQRFKTHLLETDNPKTGKPLASATINLKLSALRKLINELADNNVIQQ